MPVELELWIGEHKTESLRRGDKRLFCNEPELDDMICMPLETYDCFYRHFVLKVPCVDRE